MNGNLRCIALHIEEPDPNRFHWVLMESTGGVDRWNALEVSEQAQETWMDAWDVGTAAIMALSQTLDGGPRDEPPDDPTAI